MHAFRRQGPIVPVSTFETTRPLRTDGTPCGWQDVAGSEHYALRDVIDELRDKVLLSQYASRKVMICLAGPPRSGRSTLLEEALAGPALDRELRTLTIESPEGVWHRDDAREGGSFRPGPDPSPREPRVVVSEMTPDQAQEARARAEIRGTICYVIPVAPYPQELLLSIYEKMTDWHQPDDNFGVVLCASSPAACAGRVGLFLDLLQTTRDYNNQGPLTLEAYTKVLCDVQQRSARGGA